MKNSDRYLDLLKKSLLNQLYIEDGVRITFLVYQILGNTHRSIDATISEYLNIRRSYFFEQMVAKIKCGGMAVALFDNANGETFELKEARNFAFNAHSMIGIPRMNQLHACLDTILLENIQGDLIETGVWKGGATIFMRGFLAAHGITDRKVWVADSFCGLPPPTTEQDKGVDFSLAVYPYLAVPEKMVKALFERYDLYDEQVCFLAGWFKDTLPAAPINKLALLRLDGDMYESTWDALTALYHKVTPGGFIVVDDYLSYPGCRDAVDEFRNAENVQSPLVPIDEVSVFWRKD